LREPDGRADRRAGTPRLQGACWGGWLHLHHRGVSSTHAHGAYKLRRYTNRQTTKMLCLQSVVWLSRAVVTGGVECCVFSKLPRLLTPACVIVCPLLVVGWDGQGRANATAAQSIQHTSQCLTAHRVQRCRGFIFCLQRELAYGELLLRSIIKIPPQLFNCTYHLVVISSQRPVSTATAPSRSHALAMAGSGATRAPGLGLLLAALPPASWRGAARLMGPHSRRHCRVGAIKLPFRPSSPFCATHKTHRCIHQAGAIKLPKDLDSPSMLVFRAGGGG